MALAKCLGVEGNPSLTFFISVGRTILGTSVRGGGGRTKPSAGWTCEVAVLGESGSRTRVTDLGGSGASCLVGEVEVVCPLSSRALFSGSSRPLTVIPSFLPEGAGKRETVLVGSGGEFNFLCLSGLGCGGGGDLFLSEPSESVRTRMCAS